MRICVLSGSPKGKNSVTWQTVRYLEKCYPSDTFETVHVGQTIRALERDLSPALEAIRRAELLLFCYPVYTFLAPSQLHRFIELLKASGEDVSGKYAAQICTSKHFFDVTANRYIEENCADLKLRYVGELSADMDDLLKEQGQKDARCFWDLVRWRVANGLALPASVQRPQPNLPYKPSGLSAEKQPGRDVVIVASLAPDDKDLAAMIEDFRAQYPHPTRLVNLTEYPFAGGCISCFRCAVSGKCVYKDNFDTFLREEIQTADAIIYAFRISDHSMGARMKLFDDRQFCNGHRTVTSGMPAGYLIQGDLTDEHSLRLVIEGRAEVGGNFLAGIATDAAGVTDLVKTLEYALDHKVRLPARFWGVGGMKIFRDLIYVMRGLMKADHRYYKKHGIYDFPQKQVGTILKIQLVGLLTSNPAVQAKMGNKLIEGMLAPYEKMLAGVQPPKTED